VTSTSGGPDFAHAGQLITFGQVRALLAVGRNRASAISHDARFPRPWFVSEDGKIRLWRRKLVVAWIDSNRPRLATELDASQPGWRDDSPSPGEG
jgi:hypothetical protein